MSGFIATGDGGTTSANDIINAAFFAGVLDFVKYRAASRIDRTAADAQALSAINSAVVEVNRQLADWVADKVTLTEAHPAYATINDLPTPAHLPAEYYPNAYRRAVYALADALLAENYRDFDSTLEGNSRADAMSQRIDDYRRESIYAVADLLGTARRRIELL